MAKKAVSEPKGRGRPTKEFKMENFVIILDPRYIQYLKDISEKNDMPIQPMLRRALFEYFGNPFNKFAMQEGVIPTVSAPPLNTKGPRGKKTG